MTFRKFVFAILLMLFLSPAFNIADAATDAEPPANNLGSSQVRNIGKIIGDSTPDFISIPLIGAINASEGFRQSMSDKSEDKIYQPVFKYRLVFYLLVVIVLALAFRSIWRLVS